MSPFGWWRNRTVDSGVVEWREAWETASRAPSQEDITRLAAQLDALALSDDDVEVEREMLDGLRAAVELAAALPAGLPVLATGHRIVGADTCHFSAPASRADAEPQPAGRLLLTSRRAIFVGGPSAVTLPWHTVTETAAVARDVVLVRRDRDAASVFRCNSYADALCARLIAGRLAAAHESPRRV